MSLSYTLSCQATFDNL